MKTFTASILLFGSLCSVASAVDINVFVAEGCSGGAYGTCSNVGSNVCCNAIQGTNPPSGAGSAQWIGLPNPAEIGLYQSTEGSICGSAASLHATSGGNVCDSLDPATGQIAGAQWFDTVSKRDSSQPATECVEMDTFTLADGQKYDLKNMTDADSEELWARGAAGATAGQLPSKFAQYKL